MNKSKPGLWEEEPEKRRPRFFKLIEQELNTQTYQRSKAERNDQLGISPMINHEYFKNLVTGPDAYADWLRRRRSSDFDDWIKFEQFESRCTKIKIKFVNSNIFCGCKYSLRRLIICFTSSLLKLRNIQRNNGVT